MKSINLFKSVIQTIYDIVMAHGGEIRVNTKENGGLPAGGTGTEFIIQLPFKLN